MIDTLTRPTEEGFWFARTGSPGSDDGWELVFVAEAEDGALVAVGDGIRVGVEATHEWRGPVRPIDLAWASASPSMLAAFWQGAMPLSREVQP